jgi:2-oxoglutarate ferredoxin oxidoreductase subunit alpha
MNALPTHANATSVAILGSGGAGAITTGSLLLEAAGRAGWYGLLTRSVGPQIRGGEALAMVRLAPTPVTSHGDLFHVLVALDWHNAGRFVDEVPLNADSLIIADTEGGDPPPALLASGARLVTLPFTDLADDMPGARPNILALGMLAELLGVQAEHVTQAVVRALGRKGLSAAQAADAIAAGGQLTTTFPHAQRLAPIETRNDSTHWLITGNEAAALGALRGGVRFAAVYPITPATDLPEWMAPRLQQLGGHLIQAEDEIASINMVLGASFGGVPAMTTTSGPGLALMSETLGLAVAAEVPALVVNVMRGGPSTGIPTKSEQSDLNIALYGLHGDAPHLVLAAQSVADCLTTTHWAVQLSEILQCPAIMLSDQFLGQALTLCERPAPLPDAPPRRIAEAGVDRYDRYALTADGISPMAIPGTPGRQHTADGLEHNAHGTPSSGAADHLAQLNKRRAKLELYDYGAAWAEIEGEGETVILTWGSTSAAAFEAAEQARSAGLAVKVIALRLLWPAQPDRLALAMRGAQRALVVEQSHAAQFYHYLRAFYTLPDAVEVISQPGPLPIRPGAVLNHLLHRN